ncbi:MFS transporter [Paraburkholderia caballeronis]|uniref:MFS transporter, DHA1 family, inner membrane transport protein n=1 Tax=Paraburkholderia caballeronis TaxID=416943 RepID=A0A1H7RJJ1_9BURK|nr:MFS transporter [Paraburkholderia caballeronis]PXW23071.1 DHA1 family inner membrane transport protein [Paraburkholderia caballeronis]PXW97735.1 DHA1 family inner membrane transport protein [Paraburkholderia caballeronis]RAJ94705.1 DHA1 family inner membrane transport protein [Paraburkholderia caballeronis]TDV11766.1 DHA1 family inner membrane transport protein [Paraburkholderia caballeronis]TDV14847.1 DHA1 family inner membrane transport protein [Paraburkholderia caballeronis]
MSSSTRPAAPPAAAPAGGSTLPLLALAVGAFGIGTTEFAPMGLLPVIANGVHVSIPSAGMLVSAYAIGVMVGAPLMTLALARTSRRTALVLLMSIFTIGNLLSALAPDYTTLLLARLVTSLNHGAFFGLGSVVAASVVPRHRQASAVATMFMGLTIANVGGVPAMTWLGQTIGWRMSFVATAALGVVAMIGLWSALPKGESGRMPDVRGELAVLGRPVVLTALATTVLGAGAMFTLYTYVSPTLAQLTGASPGFVTAMLVLIGVGFSIGNVAGGRLADRSLDGSLIGFLTLLIVVMLAFPLLATSHVGAAIGLLVWGVATFAVVPPLQMRVMRAAHEAPGLASSVNVGAFNLGNALGAAAGGAAISAGLGYKAVPIAGALIAAAGLALVLVQAARQRRSSAALC